MGPNIRLRLARIARNWKQRELAEKVGLREIDISRIETRRSQPDAATKERIAAALGKPAMELFDQ